MAASTLGPLKPIAEAVSDILNCICPECGGRMGGLGFEFKCQGQCRADWRELWDSVGESSRIS